MSNSWYSDLPQYYQRQIKALGLDEAGMTRRRMMKAMAATAGTFAAGSLIRPARAATSLGYMCWEGYNDPRNSDLAWCITEGRSNPLGLCLIFMLVGRRLDLEVEGVNFPGHFMCRIFEEGYPLVIDCYEKGALHLQSTLLESPELSRNQRAILRQSADSGTILLRLLNNLNEALEMEARDEDALLIKELRATLA